MSEYERQYEDGSDPRVLDIIEVPVCGAAAKPWQPENWLLDDKFYWRKLGACAWPDLHQLTSPVAPLWVDNHSTFNGLNDCIPVELMGSVAGSLRLIPVERLMLQVFAPGEAFGNSKRRVQGRFTHAQQHYALWVTDPIYERKYLAKLDGEYPLDKCCLTISIGEPFNGRCYKLVAAIIERDRR